MIAAGIRRTGNKSLYSRAPQTWANHFIITHGQPIPSKSNRASSSGTTVVWLPTAEGSTESGLRNLPNRRRRRTRKTRIPRKPRRSLEERWLRWELPISIAVQDERNHRTASIKPSALGGPASYKRIH